MTYQTLIFLLKLRRAQMAPNEQVHVDCRTQQLKTAVDTTRPQKVVSIKHQMPEVADMITFLKKTDYLEAGGYSDTVHLTHKGYHLIQTWISILFDFLFRSIFVPIVVAMITAYLTVIFNLH